MRHDSVDSHDSLESLPATLHQKENKRSSTTQVMAFEPMFLRKNDDAESQGSAKIQV